MRTRTPQEGLTRTRREGVAPATPPSVVQTPTENTVTNTVDLGQQERIGQEGDFSQSNDYDGTDVATGDSSSGWRIEANGDIDANSLRARGPVTATSFSTGASGTEHVEINSGTENHVEFYTGNSSETAPGQVFVNSEPNDSASNRLLAMSLWSPSVSSAGADFATVELLSPRVDASFPAQVNLLPHVGGSLGTDYIAVRDTTGGYTGDGIVMGTGRNLAVAATTGITLTTTGSGSDITLTSNDDITLDPGDRLFVAGNTSITGTLSVSSSLTVSGSASTGALTSTSLNTGSITASGSVTGSIFESDTFENPSGSVSLNGSDVNLNPSSGSVNVFGNLVVDGDQWIEKSGGSAIRLQDDSGGWWAISVSSGGSLAITSSPGP
jgi:hypothetical protein